MRGKAIRVLMILVILIGLCAAKKAKVKGLLPLKPGLFVEEDTPCEMVSQATDARYYHAKGLNNGPYIYGTIIKVHNDGNVYHITQKYEYGGKLEGTPPETVNETITIRSRTSFSVIDKVEKQKMTGQKETVYRWCRD